MPDHPTAPEDIVALSLVPGAGRKTIHNSLRLAARLRRPLAEFFGVPVPDLLPQTASGETSAAAALSRCGEQEQKQATWLLNVARNGGMRFVVSGTMGYPGFLSRVLGDQAPPILFYQGNEALLDSPGAGIVGTRKPTREASRLAAACAGVFAREGIPVVSGGAAGIDLAAHQAALKADGSTVLVLPEGLHVYEPPSVLRAGLEGGQVLLISEFLPTDGWQTHRAMTRNRTIAACSSLVCVIEPRVKGGSMFTAEQALDGGKTVFYWGGACRDGALRGRKGACRLTDARGKLQKSALLHAAQHEESRPPEQIGLFD
jgi:DNA protecting protein DprA